MNPRPRFLTSMQEDPVLLATPETEAHVQEKAPSVDDEEDSRFDANMSPPSPFPIPQNVTQDTSGQISNDVEPMQEFEQATEGDSFVINDAHSEGGASSIIVPEEAASDDHAVEQHTKDDEMQNAHVSETPKMFLDDAVVSKDEHVDQRQEEEEEEVHKEDESKEEEEEASQGQDEGLQIKEVELEGQEEEDIPEDIAMDTDQNTDEAHEVSSLKSEQKIDVETESESVHTPVAETVASEAELVNDGQFSEAEEHVLPTRRRYIFVKYLRLEIKVNIQVQPEGVNHRLHLLLRPRLEPV